MQAELYHPDLGTLILGTDPYILPQLQIGSPAVRENIKNRALADGVTDNTRYLGGRAITATIRMKSASHCGGETMQALIDRITPYMHPRLRPTLTWQLPGSTDPTEIRAATVRGASWPYVIDGPKHPVIALSWAVPSGEIVEGGPDARHCISIQPAGDEQPGRTYDREGDREYPPSGPSGSRIITNAGTALTHWDLSIYGPITDPMFTVNGVDIRFDRNGGLALAAGEYIAIDTRALTALLNGDSSESRYGNMNYDEWNWDDLRLIPGPNTIRLNGADITAQTTGVLCWTGVFA